ncbi:MAG: hypothetical protein EZS28_014967 [Streblomastix strix]|uniref:Uncharacterized protein n=1 Tax=Streblomastix strix TaxID=222440 RepID=A0A5J4W3V2_9EUKA|nr:MAG: hypothetical protein EZS28_014967 [Streblomastix strix]
MASSFLFLPLDTLHPKPLQESLRITLSSIGMNREREIVEQEKEAKKQGKKRGNEDEDDDEQGMNKDEDEIGKKKGEIMKKNEVASESRLVYDLLTFEPVYTSAILYAVGSTVVFPTLEDAIDVCFGNKRSGNEKDKQGNEKRIRQGLHLRAVTIDGGLISKKGLITGLFLK